jgi:hypothetical protein
MQQLIARRVFAWAAAVLVLATSSCGGGGCCPGRATQITSTGPTTSNTWSVAGQVVATGSQQGIGGATLTPGWPLEATTADGDGNYQLGDSKAPPSKPYPLTISSPGFVSHDVWITWQPGSRVNVRLDMIREAPPFSMQFYRELVRDMYEKSEGSPWRVLRWTSAPSFYVRTVDQNGRPVEPEVLQVTLDALRRAVPAYTGGTYAAASIETGVDERPAATGWINVNFRREFNPGTITLYEDICSCGSIKVPGSVTMHEVGHAMGFFHVSDKKSLMYPFDDGGCRAGELSSAEAFHAAVAYSRPRGNTDPDHDPSSFSALAALDTGGPLVLR